LENIKKQRRYRQILVTGFSIRRFTLFTYTQKQNNIAILTIACASVWTATANCNAQDNRISGLINMIQDLQVVMMYDVARSKNYSVSCVRTFLRTSLQLEFSQNFDLRVNMVIIQYGIVLNLYVYARFDWQIIFARRNDRSRERKKNHGSRASFRMC